jgi:hypothetical protein
LIKLLFGILETTEITELVQLLVAGMMKTVPPLNDLFNMAGLNLPTYLKGDDKPEEVKSATSKESIHLLKSKNNFFII